MSHVLIIVNQSTQQIVEFTQTYTLTQVIRQAASPPLKLTVTCVCTPKHNNNNKVMHDYAMYDRM